MQIRYLIKLRISFFHKQVATKKSQTPIHPKSTMLAFTFTCWGYKRCIFIIHMERKLKKTTRGIKSAFQTGMNRNKSQTKRLHVWVSQTLSQKGVMHYNTEDLRKNICRPKAQLLKTIKQRCLDETWTVCVDFRLVLAWPCSWRRYKKAWERETSFITPWVSPPLHLPLCLMFSGVHDDRICMNSMIHL